MPKDSDHPGDLGDARGMWGRQWGLDEAEDAEKNDITASTESIRQHKTLDFIGI